MIHESPLGGLTLAERSLLVGTIAAAPGRDRFVVRVRIGSTEVSIVADRVVTSEAPVRLRPGDRVLVVLSDADGEHGFILGRIGALVAETEETAPPKPERPPVAAPGDAPDTLVIEARQSLTLRVGEGSITIREDGRILIKGKDLVSHAQRMNRIKGGSVAIN